MEEILKVENLSKTFRLSKKQQKLERTNKALKVAVDNISFTAYTFFPIVCVYCSIYPSF